LALRKGTSASRKGPGAHLRRTLGAFTAKSRLSDLTSLGLEKNKTMEFENWLGSRN
jgi:hypothetical protein